MNIKIEIKLKNKGKLLANADLVLLTSDFGWVTIKDFQIWESTVHNKRLDEFVNIEPPSVRQRFGRYIKRVFFENAGSWERVESMIYEEYKRKRAESAPINLDAIDQLP